MIELTFSVYKHTSPSGKSYIGQTSNYDRRCKEHRGSKGKAFGTAIKKYGWDSFTHHVLVAGLTLDDANSKETPDAFIPYASLTQDIVLDWITESGQLPNLEACVQGQIDSMVTPPVSLVNTPLPWPTV